VICPVSAAAHAPAPPSQSWMDALGTHVFGAFGISGEAVFENGKGSVVVATNATNAEHEAEKRADEAREKKRKGVDNWMLGDGAAELQAAKPWYYYSADAAPRKDNMGKPVSDGDELKMKYRDARCVRPRHHVVWTACLAPGCGRLLENDYVCACVCLGMLAWLESCGCGPGGKQGMTLPLLWRRSSMCRL
jgi:hypothetical protein